MALVRTTLSSACAAGDTSLVVASATGFAAGYLVRVDQEVMRVAGNYTSGTTIPVIRGQQGTVVNAHVSGAGVVAGIASDWASSQAPQTVVQYPIAGRARTLTSYSASGAIALPAAGSDAHAVLNGTSICAMTVADPSKDLDGAFLFISSNGAAAHTVTFASGLSGAGGSYDVVTINASAPVSMGPFVAVNEKWQLAVAVPLAGTVTNITATVT